MKRNDSVNGTDNKNNRPNPLVLFGVIATFMVIVLLYLIYAQLHGTSSSPSANSGAQESSYSGSGAAGGGSGGSSSSGNSASSGGTAQ